MQLTSHHVFFLMGLLLALSSVFGQFPDTCEWIIDGTYYVFDSRYVFLPISAFFLLFGAYHVAVKTLLRESKWSLWLHLILTTVTIGVFIVQHFFRTSSPRSFYQSEMMDGPTLIQNMMVLFIAAQVIFILQVATAYLRSLHGRNG